MNGSTQIYPPQNEGQGGRKYVNRTEAKLIGDEEPKPEVVEAEVLAREDQKGRLVMSLKHETSEQKLDRLARQNIVLFRIKAVWPFDFFPDELIIYENKIDVIYREFFFVSRVFPIPIANINAATIGMGPFFANINFEITGYETNPEPIRFLPKSDAIKAHRLITGLVAFSNNNVDVSKKNPSEVFRMAEELGRTKKAKVT